MGEIGKKPEAFTDNYASIKLAELPVPQRAPQQCRMAVGLDPAAFRARIEGEMRGGLPGASMADGGRSADHPLPHLDRTDVQLSEMWEKYARLYVEATALWFGGRQRPARTKFEQCRVMESAVLLERYMTPEKLAEHYRGVARKANEEIAPKGIDCPNKHCTHRIMGGKDDKPLHGRCRKCGRWWAKYGTERPLEVCERDIDRQVAKDEARVQATVAYQDARRRQNARGCLQ